MDIKMAEPIKIHMDTTGVFSQISANSTKRIVCLYGGSSSSKTISALQYLTMWGFAAEVPIIITVIGESVPVIRKSVFRDWQRVVMRERFDPNAYNKLENTYRFPNGSLLQFIPADDENRFFAMRHDIVLIDEAYNVNKGVFDQVEIRTRIQILLTWNPVAPFWGSRLQDERDDVAVIHATYKQNPHLEQSIIDALELRARSDPNFYRVFVLGKYGTLEGLIYLEGVHWKKCDALPKEYKRRLFVVDYGFTRDPTAILEIRYSDGEYWVDEIEYKAGLFNTEIAAILKGRGADRLVEVVADSAEPKSNAELVNLNLNIVPAVKGPDSVKFGIRTVQGCKLNVTTNSTNTIKELRNYSNRKDRHGELVDEPIDAWNHALDAIRYGITHVHKNPTYGSYVIG